MDHSLLLFLILSSLTGFLSVTIMLFKSFKQQIPFFKSLSRNLLLFNLWMISWLIIRYLKMYLFVETDSILIEKIFWSIIFCSYFITFGWIYTYFLFIYELLLTKSMLLLKRVISVVLLLLLGMLGFGFGVFIATNSKDLLNFSVSIIGYFSYAIPGVLSVYLYFQSKKFIKNEVRKALKILSISHTILFSVIILSMFVLSILPAVPRNAAILVDAMVLFLYSTVMLIWISKCGNAFAAENDTQRNSIINTDSLNKLKQEYGISKRELEIVDLICKGKTNKEIANSLYISQQTVKDHNYNIFQKTKVRNRTELVSLFIKNGT